MSAARLDVDLSLPRAEFRLEVGLQLPLDGVTGLFGASGSGKTSLLRALCGLEPLARGSIRMGTTVLQDANRWRPAWRRRIAMVFQDPILFDHLDVAGNLRFARPRQASTAAIGFADVVRLLGVENLLERNARQLSGGEKRRVAIAQALLSQPRLLLLDEPLGGLDDAVAMALCQRLKNCFADLELPVIVVSHRIDELLRMTSQMVMLAEGKVTACGATRDLACDLDLPLAHALDARAILSGRVVEHDAGYGLSRVQLGREYLYLPAIEIPAGVPIEVVIAARDVSITRQQPDATSILNILRARVASVAPGGPVLCTVRLLTDDQVLLAQITRKSAANLALKPGDEIWAQIKSAVLTG